MSTAPALPDARAAGTAIAGSGRADGRDGDDAARILRIAERIGNGRFNRSYTTVLSPTVNRGLQQVASANVGGTTNTQVAVCRRRQAICKIGQRQLSPGDAVDTARGGDRGGVHIEKVEERPR